MQNRKAPEHRIDVRKLLVRVVAILCAVMIVGSALLVAFS